MEHMDTNSLRLDIKYGFFFAYFNELYSSCISEERGQFSVSNSIQLGPNI
jgi:hypothetical protein